MSWIVKIKKLTPARSERKAQENGTADAKVLRPVRKMSARNGKKARARGGGGGRDGAG